LQEASSTLLGVLDEIKSGPKETLNEVSGVFSYNYRDSIIYAIGGKF